MKNLLRYLSLSVGALLFSTAKPVVAQDKKSYPQNQTAAPQDSLKQHFIAEAMAILNAPYAITPMAEKLAAIDSAQTYQLRFPADTSTGKVYDPCAKLRNSVDVDAVLAAAGDKKFIEFTDEDDHPWIMPTDSLAALRLDQDAFLKSRGYANSKLFLSQDDITSARHYNNGDKTCVGLPVDVALFSMNTGLLTRYSPLIIEDVNRHEGGHQTQTNLIPLLESIEANRPDKSASPEEHMEVYRYREYQSDTTAFDRAVEETGLPQTPAEIPTIGYYIGEVQSLREELETARQGLNSLDPRDTAAIDSAAEICDDNEFAYEASMFFDDKKIDHPTLLRSVFNLLVVNALYHEQAKNGLSSAYAEQLKDLLPKIPAVLAPALPTTSKPKQKQ